MLDTIFFGIDVSSKSNVVHVMDPGGQKLWSNQYVNSALGAEAIVTHLLEDPRCDNAYYRFGLEAAGVYGQGVAMYLRETPNFAIQKSRTCPKPKQIK